MKSKIYTLILLVSASFFLWGTSLNAQTPFVKVIQPDASGIHWATGTRHLISWTDNLTGKVNIDLINYGTHPYDTVRIASNRTGSTYSWKISSSLPVGNYYKVLVSSKNDPTVYDRSDRYFAIVKGTPGGFIHVEQPSASGISWAAGKKYRISWTDNLSEKVNIKLINYGVHPYDTTNIASNRTGSTYIWRIPSGIAPGRYYKVLVESTKNPSVYDRSDRYFAIVKGTPGGTVHVEQPSAQGISWSVGTRHLISWNDNLSEKVNIKLVNYGAHPYDTLNIASHRRGSTYIWRIPTGLTPGKYYKVLVMSSVNKSVYDRSDYYFSIIKGTSGGTIHVEQPSANGIVWSLGSRHLISWNDNLAESVDIKLVNYGVHPYDTVNIASHRRGSTYVWHISSHLAAGRYYKILVMSSVNKSVYDRSDYYFQLVKGTAGGTVRVEQPSVNGIIWSVGSRHLISWTDNLKERVTIKLVNYGVNPYDTTTIASNRRGSTYVWRISSHIASGNYYKILVMSSVNPQIYDRSDYYFKIIKGTVGGTVHVEQPSAQGIVWSLGTKHMISWTDNLYEPVDIKLVNYGVHPYDTITLATHRRGSTYVWHISNSLTPGKYYKVLVLSSVNKSVYDRSDYYFELKKGTAGGTIHVDQPNGTGINWTVGTKHLISWTDNLTEKVNIKLINYGVSPYDTTTIATNRSGSTYSWNISSHQTTGTHFKIMVVSTVNPSVYDKSDHYFTLSTGTSGGTVQMIQPTDAGISIQRGTDYLISWTDNLTEKVNIYLINYGASPYDTAIIATNRTGSTYTWHVGSHQTTGSHFKVMVASSVHPSVYGKSAHYFSIVSAKKIEVYPNPSTTQVTLKFNEKDNEIYQVSLYNRYNRRIMTREVNAAYMKRLRINTFDLPDGVYFLRLRSAQGVISKKIIVQH